MYRFLLILLSVVGMATATGAQQRQDMSKGKSNNKILVAYFSATGTTARAAEKLADVTNGELGRDERPEVATSNQEQKGKHRRLRYHLHRLSHLVGPRTAHYQYVY